MTSVSVVWNGGTSVLDLPEDENAFWKGVASLLPQISIPNSLDIVCGNHSASFKIGQRGSYVKDGVKMPSMLVSENWNNIRFPLNEPYDECYLTCINPESNNYKFYRLMPESYGIEAEYGRIGSEAGELFGVRRVQTPCETYWYWIKYYEKLSKGYVDQSEIYLGAKANTTKKKASKSTHVDSVTNRLYEQLLAYAKGYVEQHLVQTTVTKKQVSEARKVFREMGTRKTVAGFNKQLLQLMSICPRKIDGKGDAGVRSFLATSTKDFKDIMEREEDLLTAMGIVANDAENDDSEKNSDDLFKAIGVEVFEATDKQKQQVLDHLNDAQKGLVKTVYRVIPKGQQAKFDAYLKANHIHNVKQLWHGSKNCNWLSIVQNGLLLNPNAEITGKMFGNGIYFAPDSDKSWGYTSSHGSRWAHGNDSTCFMGLYATAFGKPYDLYSGYGDYQAQVKAGGCDCLFAHKGTSLFRDEIIFYSEDAMVLNYLVEFEC